MSLKDKKHNYHLKFKRKKKEKDTSPMVGDKERERLHKKHEVVIRDDGDVSGTGVPGGDCHEASFRTSSCSSSPSATPSWSWAYNRFAAAAYSRPVAAGANGLSGCGLHPRTLAR